MVVIIIYSQPLICNFKIQNSLKMEQVFSWFTQNGQSTLFRPCLPPFRMKIPKSCCRNIKRYLPWFTRGIGNIQNMHSIVCLKCEESWNTFGSQGLDKSWEYVVSTDLGNTSDTKCPWWSKWSEKDLGSNPNQQWQNLHRERNVPLNT